LGIPAADGELFRSWIHGLLEVGPTDIEAAAHGLLGFGDYLSGQITQRVEHGLGDDLISFLLQAELDGRRLTADEVFGGCLLLLVAGIDTTWSAIGSSIWHLAGNPDHQRRLRDEPELLASAVEELLRAYAPVTMAREALVDTELGGCPVHAGDPLLLAFPAANRDPELFDRPDEVLLDRSPNRHVAFGVGIHRCLGSHLARLEVSVAIERILARTRDLRLADPGAVTWSVGQVRGPRRLPLLVRA
jgi:cytochrome P450